MLQVVWDVSPFVVETSGFTLRWYSLLFGFAFFFGCSLFFWFFKKEKAPSNELIPILLTVLFAGMVGARLAHVFFYDWSYFKDHLLEIPMIWQGGLASHGAAVGMILGIWAYSRFFGTIYYWWIFDRLMVAMPTGGALIRLGNLMNGELPGSATKVGWAFIFPLHDQIPRHPVVLYEAVWSIILFAILLVLYNQPSVRKQFGLLTGFGLAYISLARFLSDFFKEGEMIVLSLKTGQLLSLPFLGLGLIILAWSFKNRTTD